MTPPHHSFSFSFPSLRNKCSSDTVLSEDYTDDYATPQLNPGQPVSASLSDTVYSQAFSLARPHSHNPINHYSQPVTPPGAAVAAAPANIPPGLHAYAAPTLPVSRPPPHQRQSPPRTLNLQHTYSSGVGRRGRNRSVSQLEAWSPAARQSRQEDTVSPSQSSRSSVDRIYAR